MAKKGKADRERRIVDLAARLDETADPLRLNILFYLYDAGAASDARRTSSVAAALEGIRGFPVGVDAVSRAVCRLRQAGFVEDTRVGREVHYTLTPWGREFVRVAMGWAGV